MPAYIDVGAIRIQDYILRTSGSGQGQLRKRRGASRMVTQATDASRFAGLGLIHNDESYAIEGVAHLRAADGVGTPPRDLAVAALAQVKWVLPAVYLEASWAIGGSYSEARALISAARESGANSDVVGVVTSLPPTREDPFAAPCSSCGLAAARSGAICEDCRLRDEAGSTKPAAGARSTPEARARAGMAEILGRELALPEDLHRLARLPRASSSKLNHVATVYADGNGIGALFEALTDANVAKVVSGQIDGAIRHAAVLALAQIQPLCRDDVFPAVVTALAADDLLVTIPASLAWPFVTTLIERFDENLAESDVIRAVLPNGPPTLSAGIAFSHVKSPIEGAIRAAFDAMGSAKRLHRTVPAVGWVDQAHPSNEMSVRPVAWFGHFRDVLTRLASTSGSQRAKWEFQLDAVEEGDVSSRDLREYFRQEGRRLGLDVLQREDLTLADLSVLLNAVRWWPPTTWFAGGQS